MKKLSLMMVSVLIISSLCIGCGSKKETKPTSTTNTNATTNSTTTEQKKEDIKVTATNLDEKRKGELIKIANDFAKYNFTRDYRTFTFDDYKKSLSFYSKGLQDKMEQIKFGETTLQREKESEDISELKSAKINEIKDYKDNNVEVDYELTVYIKQGGTLKDVTKKVHCNVVFDNDNKIVAFKNGELE